MQVETLKTYVRANLAKSDLIQVKQTMWNI